MPSRPSRPIEMLRTLAVAGAASLAAMLPSAAETPTAGEAKYAAGAFVARPVHFTSGGLRIAGMLYSPLAPSGRRPGVVLLGPFGSIKEQSPMQYASRLARDGYAALVFDPRFKGESAGEPRHLESPKAKIEDAVAAIDFLAAQADVDPARLAVLGICQGSSEMLAVAATDRRVKALATVSGQYLYPANLDGFFGGGGPTREARIARGRAARVAFERTGDVEYGPVVSLTDRSAALPWKPIHDWYMPWTSDRWMQPSRWENRYPVMSDAEVWSFDVDAIAPKVTVPALIVHGEMSDGNVAAAQHVFDLLPQGRKRLVIVPGVFHTRFYDDPAVIDPAVAQVSQWFGEHLR